MVNKNVIVRYTVKPVLAFYIEYPLEQAALDDLTAFENPMVLESMEASMQMQKKSK